MVMLYREYGVLCAWPPRELMLRVNGWYLLFWRNSGGMKHVRQWSYVHWPQGCNSARSFGALSSTTYDWRHPRKGSRGRDQWTRRNNDHYFVLPLHLSINSLWVTSRSGGRSGWGRGGVGCAEIPAFAAVIGGRVPPLRSRRQLANASHWTLGQKRGNARLTWESGGRQRGGCVS